MSALSRRDWVLLPAIAVATVLALIIAAEGVARFAWPEDKVDVCMKEGVGERPKANCTGRSKSAEGPWIESQYNDCGYRATGPCGPPLAGSLRMAVVGSSTSFGYLVPFQDVWSVQAARAITERCGRAVDVQSIVDIPRIGSRGGFGNLNDVAARLPEVAALRPQIVSLVVAPFDIFEMPDGGFQPDAVRQGPGQATLQRKTIAETIKSLLSDIRAVTVTRHFMYRDTTNYVLRYVQNGDRSGFLHTPLPPEWQVRLTYLDNAVGYMVAHLPVGTTFVLVLAPDKAQAYIVSGHLAIPGMDAHVFSRAVAAVAARHNAVFVDGVAAFRDVRDAGDYYYNVDGHLNALGQSLLGAAAAKTIVAADKIDSCQRQAAR